MRKKATKRAAAGILALGLVTPVGALAARPSRPAVHAGYVGTVSGTNAFVGVVAGGGRVTAYVCDSHSVAQWFTGPLRAGRATLRSNSGSVLAVTVGHGEALGTVRLSGATHSFSATPDGGKVGLYRGTKTVAGRRYLGGWIILRDQRQRGAVVSDTAVVASPPLNPDSPTVDVKPKDPPPKHVVIVIIAILIG